MHTYVAKYEISKSSIYITKAMRKDDMFSKHVSVEKGEEL